MNEFFETVRRFLLDYLPNQRCLSPHTILSYKQALKLFILYIREEKKIPVRKFNFSLMDKTLVLDFLDWLETAHGCSPSTRNQRLMVLRSFLKYAGHLNGIQVALYLSVLDISAEKGPGKIVQYLSEPALAALLQQPDPSKKKDLRNLMFMILLYDTAARCSEILHMKVRDLRLETTHPIAYLQGKGRKVRTVPLLPKTARHCMEYLRKFHPGENSKSEEPLFYTVRGGVRYEMSPDTVAVFLAKYGKAAAEICPEVPEHIHPHMIRHTRAMHLYQSGMPMALLSQYLGHAQVETTMIYAYADTEMKRAAIQKADAVRNRKPISEEIWADDDEMILKLSGLT